MIQECDEKPIEKTKILRVTNAPNLRFKYIVHLVSPQSASKLAEHVLEALTTVETKLKCSSIALPAIGTGKKFYYSILKLLIFTKYRVTYWTFPVKQDG